ncbi:MAG: hypothetical protein AB8B57_07900 [Congregibacter sp.]
MRKTIAAIAMSCCVLFLPACTSHATTYDQWRVFLASAEAASQHDLSERYAQLVDRQANESEDMYWLQLAYLLLRGSALNTSPSATLAEVHKALAVVADEYPLAPVRDAMLLEVRLRQRLLDAQEQFDALTLECEQSRESLLALRLQNAEMHNEIATCQDQLEAMKSIENTISEPVGKPGALKP